MAADAAAALLLTRAPIDGITEVMTDADIARHAAYVVHVADAVMARGLPINALRTPT